MNAARTPATRQQSSRQKPKQLSEYSLDFLEGYFEDIRDNPVEFLGACFGADLWEVQAEVIEAVRDNQYVSIASCHGIGKSFLSAHVVHWFLNAFPHSIVLTTAPTARQVEDILWKEINVAYERGKELFEIDGTMLNTRYNLGSDWFALGLSTDDPNRFQGYHAEYILVIVDESSGIKQEIFEAIEAVSSTGYVRVLELGNPTDPTGHFAGTFKSKFYRNFNISCFHTPNFEPFRRFDAAGNLDLMACCDALEESTFEARQKAIVRPSLISPHWVYKALYDWGKDSPMFEARCLGRFPALSNDTLIPLQWAIDASQRQIPWDDDPRTVRIGVDVARYGFDKTVLVTAKGNAVMKGDIQRYPKTATTTVSGMVVQLHWQHLEASIRVDEPGVGGGVIDELRQESVPVVNVNVGLPPDEPKGTDPKRSKRKEFLNKRAEYYWHLRNLFQSGEIAIPDDEDLIAELTAIKYEVKSNGQIKIESKDEMKKRGVNSPDSADALMLAFAPIGAVSLAQANAEPSSPEAERVSRDLRPETAGLREKVF